MANARVSAQRLRERRLAQGMTQPELAAITGISQAAVSDYEKGRRSPAGDILIRLSVALNAHPYYFAGMTDDPHYRHHVPPEWVPVITRAMELKFTPDQALRLLEAARQT